MKESKITRMRWLILWSLFIYSGVLSFGTFLPAAGQVEKEDEVRDLTRTSWKKNRAAVSGGTSRQGPEAKYKITRRMPRDTAIPPSARDSEIGVTLWRMRPAKTDDAVEIRDLIQRGNGPKEEWTPERVASDTEFHEGQILRLSIESLRPGFLYVIDRAKYQDDTYGDPYLIFPTKQIYDGNNQVEAGRAIQIPGPEEEPFTLERAQTKDGQLQESEELIILVVPQRLQSFPVAPTDRQKLSEQSVASLLKRYTAAYEVSEKIGGAGSAITVAEKRAAKTSDKRLSAENPYPQTIYRLATKPSDVMLIKVELRVRGK
jgi:Domain of unknown function (DUF4384)